jgi:hypothetical protein
MPNYCVTAKEVWHSHTYVEAEDEDDAVRLVKNGDGDTHDSDYGDTIGYVSVRNEDTGKYTDLTIPTMEEGDPNNIFSKSKKQKEVDKAVKILADPHLTSIGVGKVLENLKGIKNI